MAHAAMEIYSQIEKNLDDLFEKECPVSEHSITTDKNEILSEFKKWYDFWSSKRPKITGPNVKMNDANKLLFMKLQICDNRIVGILRELQRIGLHDDFVNKLSGDQLNVLAKN